MILTEQQVLSDAAELITDLVTSLDAEGLSYEEKSEALEDARRIFERTERVLRIMLEPASIEGKPIH
jgi:hypothetical protein